jgi:hypothetical protein
MSRYRELYRAEQLPVSWNRMFRNPDDAIHGTKGDIGFLHNLEKIFTFNKTLKPELIHTGIYYHEQTVARGDASKDVISDLFMQWTGANIDYIDPAKQEKY